MRQNNHTYKLGLARRVSDRCSDRDPVAEISKFDSTEEFARDVYEKCRALDIKWGRTDDNFYNLSAPRADLSGSKYRNADSGSFTSLDSIFSMNNASVKIVLNSSWGEKKFDSSIQITVSSFKGYNSATLYIFLYKGKVCLTNNHDMWANIQNEKDGLVFDFDKSPGTSHIFGKIVEWMYKAGTKRIKDIAYVLFRYHNPCSGYQGFIALDTENVYTYHSTTWFDDPKEPLVDDDFAPGKINSEFCGPRPYVLVRATHVDTLIPENLDHNA